MRKFIRGQSYYFEVVEIQPGDYLIISYEGQLLRVKNEMGRDVQAGQTIRLVVRSENPLQLQSYSAYIKRHERFA